MTQTPEPCALLHARAVRDHCTDEQELEVLAQQTGRTETEAAAAVAMWRGGAVPAWVQEALTP